MSSKYTTPSSTMLLLASLLLPALSLAASTAVATSPIVTTITSTYYSTGSSSTGTSISQTEVGTTSCTTSADGSTACIAPALMATVVTLYGTSVAAITTKVVSTVGYSTVYSSVADAVTSSSAQSSSTQTSIASTTPSNSDTSSTTIGTSSSASPNSSTSSPSTSRTTTSPAPANTSSSSTTTTSSSSNLGPKVALAVAIVVGLIFISLAAGYIIKKRRDRKFKRSIGAPQPGSLEKGGMTSFVAMNEINKNKNNKPDTSTSTLPTIVESRPETATPKMEQLATNVRDPPIIGAAIINTSLKTNNNNIRGSPQQRLSGLNQHSPTFPPGHGEEYGTSVFEAPARPSISADEIPPRAASLHQRRASTESARTVRTLPVEMGGGGGGFLENEGSCANPFHERGCGCRMAGGGMGMGRLEQSSVYEAFGQPRHEIGGGGVERYEMENNMLHEAGGQQRFEMQANPRYEMAAAAATPVMELEDTSTRMGIGMAS